MPNYPFFAHGMILYLRDNKIPKEISWKQEILARRWGKNQ